MKKIAIIIPAHNEEKRIAETLLNYGQYFDKLAKNKEIIYEILVVINNTQDATEKIVASYSKANKNIRYLNLKPGGKGFAIISGFKQVLQENYDLVGFVDADMATKPQDFYDLIQNIDEYDGIIASRYLKGSVVNPKNTPMRIFASRIYNYLFRSLFLLPYRDTQCGAKIFKKEALKEIIQELGMSKFAFDIEMIFLLRKKGFSIKEFPTKWSDKKYATINFWKSGPWMALAIIRLRLINSPFIFFVRFYDRILTKLYKMHDNLR